MLRATWVTAADPIRSVVLSWAGTGPLGTTGPWFALREMLGPVGRLVVRFETPRPNSGAGGVFDWAGEQRDAEAGQVRPRARQYAPGLGRFL